MLLSPGQVINHRYRIVKLLKEGGYGAIYRAWDINLDEPVALKESFGISPSSQEQFRLEAKLLFKLRHDNLPRVYDHFIIPEQGQYLVMEFVEGHDLQEMLDDRGGPLPESQVTEWIGQICDALSYLHSQTLPIIHRDIKPANIKITPKNKAVLVDFGIAKIAEPNLVTAVGARAVTPGYSPPEQYGFGTTDARSDIYSLGATSYTLLTGTVPPDSVDIMTKRMAQPPSARMLNPHVSPVVSVAIEKAMQLDCSQRYQNMEEFKTHLNQQAKVTIPAAPAVLQPSQASTAVVQKTKSRRRIGLIGLIGLIGTVSLLVLIILVVLVGGIGKKYFIGAKTSSVAVGLTTQSATTQTANSRLLTETAESPAGVIPFTPTSEYLTPTGSQAAPPTSTQTNTPIPSSVFVEEWNMQVFEEIPDSCDSPGESCWKCKCGEGGGRTSQSKGKDLPSAVLTAKTGIFIDPDWENPYLVFWEKYNFVGDAAVMAKVDGRWNYLKMYGKGSQATWVEEFIDLKKYAGQYVQVVFSVDCLSMSTGASNNRATEWYLKKIQIIPAYTGSQ